MNKTINNFWDLNAWQVANKLCLEIYSITKCFPNDEKFGMTSQLRRASVSVSSNIAEGFSRYYYKDKIRFYYQSRGSVSEIQSILFLCKDLKYINMQSFEFLITQFDESKKLINGMINSLEKRIN